MINIRIVIMDNETKRPKVIEVEAIAMFPFSFPSGRVEQFAITPAQGISEKPFVVSHVASGYKVGNPIGVATIEQARRHLITLLERVKEEGFVMAMDSNEVITVIPENDLL